MKKKPIRMLSVLLCAVLLLRLMPAAAVQAAPAARMPSFATDFEWEVLRLVNKARAQEGLQPLTMFGKLQSACDIRAGELLDVLDHTRPDGSKCFTVLPEVGVSYRTAGENIAAGQYDPAFVMDSWMNSEGHRANILTAGFMHLGVGHVYQTNTQYRHYWAQLFTANYGCSYSSLTLQLPDTMTFEVGTEIDDMGIAARITCKSCGECYLPVTSELCSGYDPNKAGTQTVTVNCFGLSASFQVTLLGHVHTFDYQVTTTPTVDTSGTLTGTCSSCSGTTTVTLPKLSTADYYYQVVTPASCTDDGSARYIWKTTTYGTLTFPVTLPKTGHSYSYVLTKEPTVGNGGTLAGTCAVCGGTTTVYTPRLAEPDYTYAVVKEPTCTENGIGRYTWKKTEYGSYSFDVEIRRTSHTYTYAVTREPTADRTGIVTQTCTQCGLTGSITLPRLDPTVYDYTVIREPNCASEGIGRYSYTLTGIGTYTFDVTLPKTGHTAVTIPEVPATCTEPGLTEGSHCPGCGEVYTEQTVIPARGHFYAYTMTKVPEVDAPGLMTRNCRNCGDAADIPMPKLSGDDYDCEILRAPTCTESGSARYTWKVTEYGVIKFEAVLSQTGHHYENGICTVCGAEEPTLIPIYSMFNPATQEHLFVMEGEIAVLESYGWLLDGISFFSKTEGIPVYRLLNPNTGMHLYTYSEDEKAACLAAGWREDGILCFTQTDGILIYRLFNINNNRHYYTAIQSIIDSMVVQGWELEGPAWFAAIP